MNAVWLTVLLVGVASIALKAVGPVLLGGRELPGPATRLVSLMAPTLLAALISTQIFADGRHLVLDARAVGLVTGAVAIWLRVPALLAVLLAAIVTALVRAVA